MKKALHLAENQMPLQISSPYQVDPGTKTLQFVHPKTKLCGNTLSEL